MGNGAMEDRKVGSRILNLRSIEEVQEVRGHDSATRPSGSTTTHTSRLTFLHPDLVDPAKNLLDLFPPYNLTRARKHPLTPTLPITVGLADDIDDLGFHLLFRGGEPCLDVLVQSARLDERGEGLFRDPKTVNPAYIFTGPEEKGGHEDPIVDGLGLLLRQQRDVEVSRSVSGEPGFRRQDGGYRKCRQVSEIS